MRWTRPFRPLIVFGDGIIDRVLCVAGAVVFSQMPEFMQQYLQRLGGHLDEARRQLERFKDVARQSGLTLDQLIANTTANTDATVARLGGVIRDASERVDTLASANDAIRNASLWERPFVFIKHIDPSIAQATWSIFNPAVPTTIEGAIYAGIGLLFFLMFYHAGVRYPVRRLARRSGRDREAVGVV